MSQPSQPPEPALAEVVPPPDAEEAQSAITQPTKLIRIASMTRAMLDEVRQAPLDEAGRKRLLEIHEASLDELRGVLPENLLGEFNEMFTSLEGLAVTESVLRIAQAQLVGWLEGLFHGIQASLWSQQLAAQTQLAQMQGQRSLQGGPQEQKEIRGGVYL